MSNAKSAELAMPRGLTVVARTEDGTFDDAGVDMWELRAAKRALLNLKSLNRGQKMMDLLAEQIEDGDIFHKDLIARSGGGYRVAETILTVTGISAADFAAHQVRSMTSGFDEVDQLKAHPEHYVMPPQYATGGIVETIGEMPVRFRPAFGEALPSAITDFGRPDEYPIALGGAPLILDDGTAFAWALHEGRETGSGAEFDLRIVYGAAASDLMIREHSEHLAIEFRNYVRAAVADPGTLSFTATTHGESVHDSGIDAWELRAAKRALRNLKRLIPGQDMVDLLADQIAESDEFHHALIARADGRYASSRTFLTVTGITGTQFIQEFVAQALAGGWDPLATHPEHYVQPPAYPAGMVETIGERPTRFQVAAGAALPDAVEEFRDPDFDLSIPTGLLSLDDGTPFAFAIHQARDTATGCEISLQIIYAATAPAIMLQEHREHLAIEFRHFLELSQ
ncbi:hypothetical protein ACFVU2_01645 [Leifsonia sp. NPDC058194]|uniref:hypothetical protein n=1 Tax=Leifsonia sp. NPDC058194 TaxID=3346374 RepID=UPI0036DA53C5